MGLFKSLILRLFDLKLKHVNEKIKNAFLYMTSDCRAWEANSLLVHFGLFNDEKINKAIYEIF